jgi:CBS domain-containing protein
MYEFLAWRVADAMSTDVVAIAPDATLADAEALFDARDFDALPVLGPDGALAGIVSKLDVLRAYHFTPEAIVPRYEEIRRRPVHAVMSLQPLTVGPDAPLTRLLETLVATRVKSLPVVEGGRLVGMVAREDVLRALRRSAAGERPPR